MDVVFPACGKMYFTLIMLEQIQDAFDFSGQFSFGVNSIPFDQLTNNE
jgi:hypothetical protein